MAKHKEQPKILIGDLVMTLIRANIMAYVVTAIFILFSSIMLTYTQVGAKFEGIIVTLGIITSSFLAGFDTAKIEDRNGYKWGAIGGLFYFIIFIVLGLLIEKLEYIAPGIILTMALIIMITSTVAGMISVNCEHERRSRG